MEMFIPMLDQQIHNVIPFRVYNTQLENTDKVDHFSNAFLIKKTTKTI